MSTHTCTSFDTHQTIAAINTAETITMLQWYEVITVSNRDATNPLYFRLDGTTAVVGADGTYVVAPGKAVTVPTGTAPSAGAAVVSLIAASTLAYDVIGSNLSPIT